VVELVPSPADDLLRLSIFRTFRRHDVRKFEPDREVVPQIWGDLAIPAGLANALVDSRFFIFRAMLLPHPEIGLIRDHLSSPLLWGTPVARLNRNRLSKGGDLISSHAWNCGEFVHGGHPLFANGLEKEDRS
jgi:hypothetical protein